MVLNVLYQDVARQALVLIANKVRTVKAFFPKSLVERNLRVVFARCKRVFYYAFVQYLLCLFRLSGTSFQTVQRQGSPGGYQQMPKEPSVPLPSHLTMGLDIRF